MIKVGKHAFDPASVVLTRQSGAMAAVRLVGVSTEYHQKFESAAEATTALDLLDGHALGGEGDTVRVNTNLLSAAIDMGKAADESFRVHVLLDGMVDGAGKALAEIVKYKTEAEAQQAIDALL